MAIPTVSTSFERWFISSDAIYNELDGTSTIVDVYHIKLKSVAPWTPITPTGVVSWDGADYEKLIAEGVIPANGTDRAAWLPAAYPVCDFPQGTMRCRSTEITTNKTGDIRVTITWTTLYSVQPSTIGTATVYKGLPATMEWQGGTRTMKAWRRTWATNPPTTSNATATDIGGFNYSGKIEGVNQQVPQVRVRIKFTIDASQVSMISQYTNVSGYIGCINSATFMNFPIGTVICEGITMGKLQHEYYELIFEFLWDKFAHHDQVPATEGDGQIEEDSQGNAKTVKWERIDRTSVDFNNIYGGDATLKALVETGYWI